MKPYIRTLIAYIAGCLITKKPFTSILDQSYDTTYMLNGNFNGENIDVIDLTFGAKIVGMVMGNDASFAFYEDKVTVILKLNGDKFTGYAGSSSQIFNGDVVGMSVKLYDSIDEKHYLYKLSE